MKFFFQLQNHSLLIFEQFYGNPTYVYAMCVWFQYTKTACGDMTVLAFSVLKMCLRECPVHTVKLSTNYQTIMLYQCKQRTHVDYYMEYLYSVNLLTDSQLRMWKGIDTIDYPRLIGDLHTRI